MVADAPAVDERELARYAQRVSDRWALSRAVAGGARIEDARGALPQRERGEEFVVVLVSEFFDGVPWLERVYQAASLWDAAAMGARADVHCYTPVELERKIESMPAVRRAVESGLEIEIERARSGA